MSLESHGSRHEGHAHEHRDSRDHEIGLSPHAHSHAPKEFGRAFAIGVGLNLVFVAIESFYGSKVDSLALLADAGHNLSDVAGLLLAWAAFRAAKLRADERHTYGWRRGSIIASFVNAVVLLVAMGSLAWEAAQRLQAPTPVEGVTMMAVAGVGVVINTVTAWLFMSGSREDLNIRAAFLHMAADALVSIGVVAAGALYLWQGWGWIDPVMSLVIAAVIVAGTFGLFKQSLHLLFDGVPEGIDLGQVRAELAALPGVKNVHHVHVWATSTQERALTAHLVTDGREVSALLEGANVVLAERVGITHVTIQTEDADYAFRCCGVGA